MPSFELTLPNLKAFEEQYAKAPQQTVKVLGDAIKAATIAVQATAMSQAPVRTGKLRAAIAFETKGLEGHVFSNLRLAPYAIYVHEGTGIYGKNKRPIVPVNKKILASKINPGWGARNAKGYYIIGRKSKGQRANPFMERTVKLARRRVDGIFQDAEQKLIQGLKV